MTDNILNFIQEHAEWAAVIVFIGAFLESIALVGLFVPGWVFLVGVGTLVGADVLPFYPIVIAAYLGAVIGEYLSFMLGYRYHEKILSWPLFVRHQELIEKGHRWFNQYGGAGVFIGRFFGPTRAVVPFIAGIAEMPPRVFNWINMTSGLLWAPFYLIPGILAGAALQLEKQEGHYLIAIMVMFGLVLAMVFQYAKGFFLAMDEGRDSKMPLTKLALALAILVVMSVILMRSPYWALFKQIFAVLASKL